MKGAGRGSPKRLPEEADGKRRRVPIRGSKDDIQTACERKISYESVALALAGMMLIRDAEGLVAYRCGECRLWHLGHRHAS